MKKLILILAILWLGLNAFANSVKANDRTLVTIGHVIQTKVSGEDININELFDNELKDLSHKYALEMISILQAYLPAILDGAMTEMRLELDKKYKCLLLEGSTIQNKECN